MSPIRLRFLRSAIAACLVGIAAVACAPDHPIGPSDRDVPRTPSYKYTYGYDSTGAYDDDDYEWDDEHDFDSPNSIYSPDWRGWGAGNQSSVQSKLTRCTRREAATGSAIIGSKGGTLVIGTNRLIVPPGALLQPTLITGTVPSDTILSIHLEPSGLTFKRPVGLVMDVTGCDESGWTMAHDVYYVNDAGEIVERIRAVFGTMWHTIAAPLNHFSQYAIAV